MGLYCLDLDELALYKGVSVEELKGKSYADLEAMISYMKNDKIIRQNNRNAKDKEYERLVLTYFEPVSLLRHWFDEKDIIMACAMTGIRDRDLCEECMMPVGSICHVNNAEYLRTSVESVPQFDAKGHELLRRGSEKRDVYRIANRYQNVCQGKAILYMLYERYPDLGRFGFSAYGMSCMESNYEIYPKNGIYTPFTALMSGDIDAILFRNREYCRSYNHGRYSPEECEKAFHTEEALEMFDTIYRIGVKERTAGRFPVSKDENGRLVRTDGLKETKVSKTNNIIMLREKNRYSGQAEKLRFTLSCASTYSLERLVAEFLEMVKEASEVTIHVYHIRDYLGEYGIHMKVNPNWFGADTLKFERNGKDSSGYVVNNIFGWSKSSRYDLTLRIDCPEIGR